MKASRFRAIFSYCFLVLSFCCRAGAQSSVQAIWSNPDGNAVDYTDQYINGNTTVISWSEFGGTNQLNASDQLLDLWVTSTDPTRFPFSQLLTKGVDLTRPEGGEYSWTINIPDNVLTANAKYVLRFKIPAQSYDPDTAEISSPSFIILAGQTSATSNSSTPSIQLSSTTSTAASSTTSTTASSITSTAASSISQTPVSSTSSSTASPSPKSNGGLSTGAKVGIGVGVAGAVIVAVSIGAFLLRRWRRRSLGPGGKDKNGIHGKGEQMRGVPEGVQEASPTEMPSSSEPHELGPSETRG